MSVLKRATLQASPLADLHALASELSIDGYRRLRKEELIDAILGRADAGRASADAEPEMGEGEPRRTRRRGGRARGTQSRDAGEERARDLPAISAEQPVVDGEPTPAEPPQPKRRRRAVAATEAGQPLSKADSEEIEVAAPDAEHVGRDGELADDAQHGEGDGQRAEVQEIVEGVVELLPNGSGFLRVSPPDPSEDDVYISAAQVKRCELVSGDRVSGPRRAPRRSERFASLVRIDTINGAPASELADGLRYEDLPAEFPTERFKLGSQDPTVKAIEWLTPIGRGSRVCIVGPARSGKSEALRRLLEALAGEEGLHCSLVLAGVRPEEIMQWGRGPVRPLAAVSIAQSGDAQLHAVELAIEQAKRLAARGEDALVAIDTLAWLPPASARKALAAARNISGGGSLTVIATAPAPLGGETTVIKLDPDLACTARYPALDLAASGTIHDELLVGSAGSEAIARARLEALEELRGTREQPDGLADPHGGGFGAEVAGAGSQEDEPLPTPPAL